jgi:LemA protein
MKKGSITILVIVVIAVILCMQGCNAYNGMVQDQEKATTAAANVQSSYQRRADLIPNLVETVKGYAKHEENTFKEVIEARAKATQITLDTENLTPEKLQQFQQAQGDVTSALGKLIAVSEAYPDLKANEQFMSLQTQLEGCENRINEARNKYNAAVQTYNTNIRSFPKNIFAGLFGFDRMTKFEAQAGADKAPEVKF